MTTAILIYVWLVGAVTTIGCLALLDGEGSPMAPRTILVHVAIIALWPLSVPVLTVAALTRD